MMEELESISFEHLLDAYWVYSMNMEENIASSYKVADDSLELNDG